MMAMVISYHRWFRTGSDNMLSLLVWRLTRDDAMVTFGSKVLSGFDHSIIVICL